MLGAELSYDIADDIDNQGAAFLAREEDPEGLRTIGICIFRLLHELLADSLKVCSQSLTQSSTVKRTGGSGYWKAAAIR